MTRDFFTNWTINTAAATALSLSIITVITAYKRRIDRFLEMYIIFTVGLAVWLVAEVTWTYYQLVLQIVTPFPSSADAFWLSGYGFFTYFMFRIYNFLSKGNEKLLPLIVIFTPLRTALPVITTWVPSVPLTVAGFKIIVLPYSVPRNYGVP